MKATLLPETDVPELIKINDLHAHPNNPRLSVREDTVAQIMVGIAQGFDAAHALIVRPNATGYEIISGSSTRSTTLPPTTLT